MNRTGEAEDLNYNLTKDKIIEEDINREPEKIKQKTKI